MNVGLVLTTATSFFAAYQVQLAQRQGVGQLAANTQVLFSSDPINAEINAIPATGLSQSALVQFPNQHQVESAGGILMVSNRKNSERDQFIHEAIVTSVSFSPDGKRIVSGSGDKTVRVWDALTGKPIGKPFQGHRLHVTCVSFSPDGKRIVSSSGDKTVRVWDALTGKPIGKRLHGHGLYVTSVSFSPDRKRIVSGSWDKTVRVWDARTGKPIGKPLHGHESSVNSVSFSPDGKRIVSGSWDKTVRVWDTRTRKIIGKRSKIQYSEVKGVLSGRLH